MNCTADEVRLVVHTALTDAEIESIIASSDAQITKRAGSRITGELAKKLSVLMTASTIKTRQPGSSAIGEYREETGDIGETWAREIEAIYRLHSVPAVAATLYQSIVEDDRYTEGP